MIAKLPENRFKRALAEGKQQIGLWSSLANPHSAEIIAGSGYDWLLFDTEHTPIEVAGLVEILRAAHAATHSAVRVMWNDPVMIKRVLDVGAQTLFVPFVETAAEAGMAVQACQYPPSGIRGVAGATRASGYGRVADYHASAGRELCVVVQIETKSAVDHLEEIAAVPGVDAVFIGPSDLSASFGFLGRSQAPQMQAILQSCAKRLQVVGARSGILAGSAEQALQYFDYGYDFVAAGVDTALLARATDALLCSVVNGLKGEKANS